MPYAKNYLRVNVPKHSGFDKSHRNSGTLTCGTLTPLLCDELIPASRVSLKVNLAAQLPPLASDTYMNLKLKAEAFFCPFRLLSKSFEDFFCDDNPKEVFVNGSPLTDVVPRMPFMDKNSPYASLGVGSLADYLGLKDSQVSGYTDINLAAFEAYHLIWQEWYRNPRVQKPAFVPQTGGAPAKVKCMPFTYFGTTVSGNATQKSILSPALSADIASDWHLYDGVSLFALRQRNFGLDYFTGARVDAQQGPAVSLSLPVSGQVSGGTNVSGTGSFTIAALRAANSLQQFRERNNLPSPRLVDQVKARYGATLSDGVAQRPICIGSATYDVDSTGVNQTSADPSGAGSSTSNPFSAVAAQYGRAYASGSDFLIEDFTANEPGLLMVLVSLVPEVTYYSGLDRMFTRYTSDGSIVEMANPLLQNMGDQPIYQHEIAAASGSYYDHVFGYQDRFGEFMFKPNVVHGEMRFGRSLQSFVVQRGFSGATPLDLSSAFLEIPTNYLDQCFAVAGEVSGLSAWYDSILEYHVSMPLAEFSIPSLQDPAYEHGHSISIRRNGQIF